MNILVIRRDNIGDLVCTTPLLAALRRHYPAAHIAVLVNSYNAPVLAGNPDINEICIYRKAKHRAPGESLIGIWWETFRLLRRLRAVRFDLAIVATPGRQPAALKFARWVAAARTLAYGRIGDDISDFLPLTGVDGVSTIDGLHETEAVMRLLAPLGITEAPGSLRVFAAADAVATTTLPAGRGPLIALHISARKPLQRWPIERFGELARKLHVLHDARFLLFWSPGDENHPQHPGDDRKAAQLQALCPDLPLLPWPTEHLGELIAGLSLADLVICSDGGAMHLAAGLGKPIVCFFGNSDVERWRPWGIPCEILQPASRQVADISLEDALAAVQRLTAKLDSDTRQLFRSDT